MSPPVPMLHYLKNSLSGFARSLQERLMSLPVYDGCRPSSRYFSYNENQPEVSIEEVHRNNNSNNSRGVAAPSGLSITSAAAQSNSGINTSVNSSTGTSCGSSSNGSGNGSINESADTPDDCSVGVFLSKNYRYNFCAL